MTHPSFAEDGLDCPIYKWNLVIGLNSNVGVNRRTLYFYEGSKDNSTVNVDNGKYPADV